MTDEAMGDSKLRATLEDLRRLVEQGLAVELIDGEIVPKASPTGRHGQGQAKLAEVLGPFHRRAGGPRGPGGWWILLETEVVYGKTEEVFRSDAIGLRRESHPEVPAEWPMRARPDWVAEILSPSTARYDLVKKQRTLHLHAVPHYWLIDPERETLTVLRYAAEGYVQVVTATVGDVVRAEPFEAIEVSVGELFGKE